MVVSGQGNQKMSVSRLETLVDGIFAIAMTLLVFNIAMPPDSEVTTDVKFFELLKSLWPHLEVFVFSFMLLAIFWFHHHRAFHFVRETDSAFLWINIFWLLFVALVPFSASVVTDFGNQKAGALFFHSNMLAIGLLGALNLRYAIWKGLIGDNSDKQILRLLRLRSLFLPVLSLCAIGISLFRPGQSSYAYLVIILLNIFLKTKLIKP